LAYLFHVAAVLRGYWSRGDIRDRRCGDRFG
jgi:hypothetical protein